MMHIIEWGQSLHSLHGNTSVGPLTESDHNSYGTDYVKGPTSRALKISGNNIIKGHYLSRYHGETSTFPANP